MILLGPITDKTELKVFYENHNLMLEADSGCVTAMEKGNLVGYSIYNLNSKNMVIKEIFPMDDLALADGILRSTLHIAAERSVMDVYYEKDNSFESLLKKLDFIKNKEDCSLKINKLFESCCSCK